MEKLTIEIELTKEEVEAFNNFIERKCLDANKWYKRLLLSAIEKINNRESKRK